MLTSHYNAATASPLCMLHTTTNTFNTNSTRQHTDVLRRLENDERKKALAAKLETADENEKVYYNI
jgi:hypothetical protein